MFYFAYGSNLLTQRLVHRCDAARPLGVAQASGYRVGFAKYSHVDGSGKATILPDAGAAWGVLYELPKTQLEVLDEIEGVGKGYDRLEALTVEGQDGACEAVSYIASEPREGLPPFDWYLALILAGARQHRLPEDVCQAFYDTDHVPDPEPERPGYLAAVKALEAAGHTGWRSLLRSLDAAELPEQRPSAADNTYQFKNI